MISENNFYTEIECLLLEKRGRGILISASDYRIMKKWEDMGIPIDVIKKGIDFSVDGIKFSKRDKVNGIITLSSCNRQVLKLWRERSEARRGLQEEWGIDSGGTGQNLSEDISAMISALEKNISDKWISPQISEEVDAFRNGLKKLITGSEKKCAESKEEEYEKLEKLREEYFEKIILLLDEENKKEFLSRWDKNLKRIKETTGKNEFEKTSKELLKITIAEKLGV